MVGFLVTFTFVIPRNQSTHNISFLPRDRPEKTVVPFMVTIRAQPLPIPPYDIEVYDRALYLLLKFGFVDALRKMQQSTRKDFRQIDDVSGYSPDMPF
jgi:hypothetical protein